MPREMVIPFPALSRTNNCSAYIICKARCFLLDSYNQTQNRLSFLLKIYRFLNVTPNDILAGKYNIEEENNSNFQTTFTLNGMKPADKTALSNIYYFMCNRA